MGANIGPWLGCGRRFPHPNGTFPDALKNSGDVGTHTGPLFMMWETVPTSLTWPGPGAGAGRTHVRDVGTVSHIPNRGPVSVPTSPEFLNTSGKVPLGCGNRFPGPNHVFSYVYGQETGPRSRFLKKSRFCRFLKSSNMHTYIFHASFCQDRVYGGRGRVVL